MRKVLLSIVVICFLGITQNALAQEWYKNRVLMPPEIERPITGFGYMTVDAGVFAHTAECRVQFGGGLWNYLASNGMPGGGGLGRTEAFEAYNCTDPNCGLDNRLHVKLSTEPDEPFPIVAEQSNMTIGSLTGSIKCNEATEILKATWSLKGQWENGTSIGSGPSIWKMSGESMDKWGPVKFSGSTRIEGLGALELITFK